MTEKEIIKFKKDNHLFNKQSQDLEAADRLANIPDQPP